MSGGTAGAVEVPFAWSESASAILAVAKRGKLLRDDGLANGIRVIDGNGLSLMARQEEVFIAPFFTLKHIDSDNLTHCLSSLPTGVRPQQMPRLGVR